METRLKIDHEWEIDKAASVYQGVDDSTPDITRNTESLLDTDWRWGAVGIAEIIALAALLTTLYWYVNTGQLLPW